MRPPTHDTARTSADVAFRDPSLATSLEKRRVGNVLGLLRLPVLAVFALVLAGCGSSSAEPTKAPPAESTVTSGIVDEPVSECPVTMPPEPGLEVSAPDDVVYTEAFPAPEPYPHRYPRDGMVWYGTEDLWTALPVDGDYVARKSVWWSTNFPGGMVEEQPEVWVTWTRLDIPEPVVMDNGGRATNAHTGEDGWFMVAGIDPDEPGCWKVEATYKDATLSYVYERS